MVMLTFSALLVQNIYCIIFCFLHIWVARQEQTTYFPLHLFKKVNNRYTLLWHHIDDYLLPPSVTLCCTLAESLPLTACVTSFMNDPLFCLDLLYVKMYVCLYMYFYRMLIAINNSLILNYRWLWDWWLLLTLLHRQTQLTENSILYRRLLKNSSN